MSSKFLNANTDVNLSANSDSQIPSQKAVKTYVDNKTSVLATKEEVTTITNQISDQVSGIASKIPEAASDTNQLADKQFVQDLTSALNFVQWVDSLPETGESKYIYAVPREETDTDGKQIAALYLWDGVRWNGAGAFSLNVDPDTLATKAELAGYLPLSGGIINGELKVVGPKSTIKTYSGNETSGYTYLELKAADNNQAVIVLTNIDGETRFRQRGKNTEISNLAYKKYLIISSILTFDNNKVLDASDKAVANGVASLDGTAKLPVNQLPNNVILNGDVLLDLLGSPDKSKRIYQQKIDDTFYCADKRFTVTLTNFDNYPDRLFDANDDSYISLPKGQTGSVFIEGPYNFGPGYPYGYIYVVFYHGCGLTDISNITCRVYQDWTGHNVGWVNLNAEEIRSLQFGGYKSIEVVRFRVSPYGIRKIELNFDNTDGTSPSEGDNLRVTFLSYFKERVPIEELPVVTKVGANTLYGNVTIPTQHGSFIGNLTGTASRATADASGNTITTTYATKNELNTGLSSKQGTLTAGTGISITDSTISNAFTSLDSYTTFSEAALNENSSFIYKNTDGAYLRGNFINFVDSIIKPSFATKSDLSTKQNTISDLDTIRSGAALGSTALQSVPEEYITESELAAKNYATTTDVTTGLSTKQDTISDLYTIREGAALGATSVQHEDLSEVAISGMYSDLTGTPGAATTDTLGLVKVDGTTITATADGVISAVGGSGSGFDFEGTKAEFDAAVAAGTITEDSVSLITDDVSGDNVATKEELQAVDRSKADTSLSNVLANIDYVIESKTPTTDDPTWYRKYKSGWLEQGGIVTAAGEVTLLKPFANTAYSVQATSLYTHYTNWGFGVNKTSVSSFYLNMNTGSQGAMWEAKGQGAN